MSGIYQKQTQTGSISTPSTGTTFFGVDDTERAFIKRTDGSVVFLSNTGSYDSSITGSSITTASVSSDIITFTKGDGSTFPVNIPSEFSQYFFVSDAVGDGVTDDTTALQNSINAVSESGTLLLDPDKIYKVNQLEVSQSITILGNNSKILSTDNSTAHSIIYVSESVNKFQINDIVVEYQGPFYDDASSKPAVQGSIPSYAYDVGPDIEGIRSDATENTIKNVEVFGCSTYGIRLYLSTSLNYAENINAHNNGYAGFFARSGKNTVIGGSFNDNGGNNAIDGYGVIINNKYGSRFANLNPEEESGIVMGATANRNMSRGIDTHHGDDIVITNNHCENNGCTSSYWDGNSTNAYQIQIVNDCTKVIVSNNVCKGSFDNVAVIKVGGTTGYKHGIKEAHITDNVIIASTSSLSGIQFNPFMTTNAIIANNTVRHILGGLDTEAYFSQSITLPSELSIVMGGAISTGSYVENLTISDNIFDGVIDMQFRGTIPTSSYITGSSLTPNVSSSGTGSLIIAGNKASDISYSSYGFLNSSSRYINSSNNVVNGFDYTITGNGGEIFKSNNDTINSYLVQSGFNGSINTFSASADINNATIHNSYRYAINNFASDTTNVSNCTVVNPNRIGSPTTAVIYYNGDAINNKITGNGNGIGFQDRSFSLDHKLIGNKVSNLSFGWRADLNEYSGSSTLTYTTLPTIDLDNKFIEINEAIVDPAFVLEKGVKIPKSTAGDIDEYEYTDRIVTNKFTGTTTSAGASSGASSISVNDITGYEVGGNIAVLLDDGSYQWTTITGISGTTITLNDTLTDDVASGNNVGGYKTSQVGLVGLFEENEFKYDSTINSLQLVSNNHGIAGAINSFAQGSGSRAGATGAHAQGFFTTASNVYAHSEGYYTKAAADYAHAEGDDTLANNFAAHAEGRRTTSSGQWAHAEGFNTLALGNYSHAEGYDTIAGGVASHVAGLEARSNGHYSYAQGYQSLTTGDYAVALGRKTSGSGVSSLAHGNSTKALGDYSHAEGYQTFASGTYSHAEGKDTTTTGSYSHATGHHTTANGIYQSVVGQFNTYEDSTSRFIVGGGTDNTNRVDAFKVTADNRTVFVTQSGDPASGAGVEGEFFLSGSSIYVYIEGVWKSTTLT